MDSHTVGFLVEEGDPDSHAAILARALRRPAVSGVQNLCGTISPKSDILINGDTGEVILNPSEQTLAGYAGALADGGLTLEITDPVSQLQVMVNIERGADVHDALAIGAEGIGLYRTEMETLAAGR